MCRTNVLFLQDERNQIIAASYWFNLVSILSDPDGSVVKASISET